MLLSQGDVFALSDEELGETDLVTHNIDTGSSKGHASKDCHMQ